MKDVWNLIRIMSSLEAYWWRWNGGEDLQRELIGAVYQVFYWGRMNAEASDEAKPWADVERNVYVFLESKKRRRLR